MEAATLDDLAHRSRFDYCIIGAGPAGLTAARELARHGTTIVIEAGTDTASRAYNDLRAETTDSILIAKSGVYPANPWTLRGPGGGMERYAGILFRYRTADFARSSNFPAATADPDWPFDYDALKPYYDELEQHIGIARAAGADATEPPSCAPVMPPHDPSPRAVRINEAFDALGMSHFTTPLGVNSLPYRGRPMCSHCGFCNETACASGAKASPLRIEDHTGNLVLVRGAWADTIHVAASGNASAVECVHAATSTRVLVHASTFVLAAGALNTCALLLRSTSRSHPRGLGNARDQVGRGIQFKLTGYAATVDRSLPAEDDPTLFSTTATTHCYEDIPASGCGGLMYEAAALHEPQTARLHYIVPESPQTANVVRPARTSRPGPNLIIRHEYLEDDIKRLRALESVAHDVLGRIGADVATVEEPNATGRAHLAGGCRSGTDPATSVVDANGRVHDSDNVYVADAAFFPYAAAVNPTFTIMANALRIARTLASEHPGAS